MNPMMARRAVLMDQDGCKIGTSISFMKDIKVLTEPSMSCSTQLCSPAKSLGDDQRLRDKSFFQLQTYKSIKGGVKKTCKIFLKTCHWE